MARYMRLPCLDSIRVTASIVLYFHHIESKQIVLWDSPMPRIQLHVRGTSEDCYVLYLGYLIAA